MKILHILIVEDEMMVAMNLEMMITEFVQATVVIEASVAGTKRVLDKEIDFAFLDIDVTNGKTFELAKILERKHVPFVFVSGSCQAELPFELHCAPFIPKPFCAAQIERALQAFVNPARIARRMPNSYGSCAIIESARHPRLLETIKKIATM